MNAVSSVSKTSAIVSGIAVYQYKWAVSSVLEFNLYFSDILAMHFKDTLVAKKDASPKLTDQENTTLAISSLVVIFSTIEVALAVCAAWSSDSLYRPTQESQVSQVFDIYILWSHEK